MDKREITRKLFYHKISLYCQNSTGIYKVEPTLYAWRVSKVKDTDEEVLVRTDNKVEILKTMAQISPYRNWQ